MTAITRRVIGPGERPWAARRDFQRFFGIYELDQHAGIYFDQDIGEDDRRLLSATFKRLPAKLQRRCREYEVTFSTCVGCTASGHSSAFYADFRRTREFISPHIEMSRRSLAPDMVLPHMAHEAAHLWWRTLPEDARQAYTSMLLASCQPDTVEVTEYVQDHFLSYWKALAAGETEDANPYRRTYRSLWVEESFCDSVAVLRVPEYPSRRQDSSVNLAERGETIKNVAGLQVG